MTAASRGPAADALQAQIDKTKQAQENLDRDPEAAADLLAPGTVVSDGSPITMQDMFGLFVQLQNQQVAMQQQLVALLSEDRNARAKMEDKTKAHTAEELAQAAEQQRLTLLAWKTEPRLPIFLEPDADEQKIASVVGEFPPRMHRVNGLEYPIKVGEVVAVPESIAASIKWAQGYVNRRRKPAQAVAAIDDPEHLPFLTHSQSISPGQHGKIGEGRLVATSAALSPDRAGPLDIRYDGEGN